MATPHLLPGTEIVALPASASGRRYQLHVAIPGSAARNPGRRHPVVYLTDPYWDFPLVYATHGNLVFDQAIPECVLVGIGYEGEGLDYEALRVGDLAPVPDPQGRHPAPGGGWASAFLGFLEDQVIPLVERSYPVDPARRVMLGSSMGALFALFAMFTRPGLVQSTVAVSPAVLWANEWIFGLEERFAAGREQLRGRLFLSGAAEEWPYFLGPLVRFKERVWARAYPGLALQWRLIDGEKHSGTKAEGFTRGLRFAFEGQTGPV